MAWPSSVSSNLFVANETLMPMVERPRHTSFCKCGLFISYLLQYPEPGCNIRSSQRVDCFGDSATEMQKAPYVTPELCIQKGCCYDDMFMSEPNVKFYSAEGRTWCFKKKGGGTVL